MHIIAYGHPSVADLDSVSEESVVTPMTALAAGFYHQGHSVGWRNHNVFTPRQTEDCDLVIVTGLRDRCRAVRDAYAHKSVCTIVLELAFHGRGHSHFAACRAAEMPHYQLGLGEINWLPPGPCPDDRAEMIGLIAPETFRTDGRTDGDSILLLGQKSRDAQHTISDMRAWARERLAAIRRDYPGIPVIWRSHPEEVFELPGADETHDPREVTLSASLARARRVVTHNSTAAYAAILAGVPVQSDPAAVYHGAFSTLDRETIQAFLNRVAYAQWNGAEMLGGAAVSFLLAQIQKQRAETSLTPEQSAAEIGLLRGQVALLERELSESAREGERLVERAQRLERECAELQDQLVAARERASELEQENAALRAPVNPVNEETASAGQAERNARRGRGR